MGIDRPPADPKKRAEWEANLQLEATQADQAAAKRRYDEDSARVAATAKEDAVKIAADEKRKTDEKTRVEKKQKDARERYIATPLTDTDRAEWVALEAAANGPGNGEPDMMRRLADLRIRSKVKVEKPKKGKE